MKVAAVQLSGFPEDIQANLEQIRVSAQRGAEAGCRVVLFPEISDIGYSLTAIPKHKHASWPLVHDTLGGVARKFDLCLVCGVCVTEGQTAFNSLVAWGPDGQILSRYDKIHLFQNNEADETLVFSPGHLIQGFTFEGFRFGLTVCYDLRFPELFRALALDGCQGLLVASAWPQSRINVWETLCQARAMENQCYLVGANRVGKQGAFDCGGRSVIAAPWGILNQAEAEGETIIMADLDPEALRQSRKALPSLTHRRPDVYAMTALCSQALTQG